VVGNTALMVASEQGHAEVVRTLWRLGADVDARGLVRRNALMQAAAAGHAEVVEILLEAGARPALRDANGETAVVLARKRRRDGVASLLEQHRNGGGGVLGIF
jgi:ankyrin repeat protein